MRTERGASQVLFGMLPQQTVDLENQVWRVVRWDDPIPLKLDPTTVRRAMLSAISPWIASGKDSGLAADLRRGISVEIVDVNADRGVTVEPYPKQWRCRACNRIARERGKVCICTKKSWAQMQFVAFHECGALKEPRLPSCKTHQQCAVRLPGTAAARELYFYCPVCQVSLSTSGFPFQPCECGAQEGMQRNVHRASAVFTPHFAVVVNPPDPGESERLRAQGGTAAALQWVLDGMVESGPGSGRDSEAGFVQSLLQLGISLDTAKELAKKQIAEGKLKAEKGGDPLLSADAKERAEEAAFSLASACAAGRVRVADMSANTTPPLRTLYESAYPSAFAATHLLEVELLPNFPVATFAFGYSRGGGQPGSSSLVAFGDHGDLRGHGSLSRTEALLFRMDPLAVHSHLVAKGLQLATVGDTRNARIDLIEGSRIPSATDEHPEAIGGALLTLLHSFSHRLIRRLANFAGVERDSLAEYLIPEHLSVIVYAAAHGSFVLGGLQALFEQSLDALLDDVVNGERRCPLDPGCRDGGGACMACLHLGEPSCRWFNRFLHRDSLFSPHGFFA